MTKPTHILWFESLPGIELTALCTGSSGDCAQVRNYLLRDETDMKIRTKYGIFTQLKGTRFQNYRVMAAPDIPSAQDLLQSLRLRDGVLDATVNWDLVREAFILRGKQLRGIEVEEPTTMELKHQLEVVELYTTGQLHVTRL